MFKKTTVLFIALTMILGVCLFSGCKKTSNSKENESGSSAAETPVTENPLDFGENNFLNAEIKSEDENYYYLRDKVLLSQAYPKAKVDFGELNVKDSGGEYIFPRSIDNEYNVFHSRDSKDNKKGEIGIYNLKSKTYKKLIDLPLLSQASIVAVNEKYLVWMEGMDDSNWGKTTLHLYNRATNEDEVFHMAATNPETETVYAWNWRKPIIMGDKIYFDDIVGFENEIYKVNMFCYDVVLKKTELFQEMAKMPMIWNGQIAWTEMGKTKDDVLFKTMENDERITVFEIHTYKFFASMNSQGKIAIVLNNLNTETHKLLNPKASSSSNRVDCSGLQVYKNNKVIPILITKQSKYLGSPVSDGRFVVLEQMDLYHSPVFYDSEKDEIINLDTVDSSFVYSGVMGGDMLMYVRNETKDDANARWSYYLINLNELK